MKYAELRDEIRDEINSNGNHEITGDTLQGVLLDMVDTMEKSAGEGEGGDTPDVPVEPQALLVPITWAELKALRDNGELVAGMQYRITDFVTTTAQENTTSAGHPFDVIVTADDEHTLNEVARAIEHEGDTYFSDNGARLETWQIWYCLDNDVARFAWADEANGKGVIYRMIDEWNNDLPYDFKNIIFDFPHSFVYSQWGGNYEFLRNTSLDKVIDGVQYYGWTSDRTPTAWSEPNCWTTEEIPTTDITLYNTYGNIISFGGNIVSVNTETSERCTFNTAEGADASLNVSSVATYGNTMGVYRVNGVCTLNRNSFGDNCYYNSFGDDCYSNSFGNNCSSNSFGNNCSSNSFGNNCYSNSFGDDCYYNSFGNNCYYNSFGDNCYYNSFGDDCYSNSFGNNCSSNSFGNNCSSNSFGNNCSSNSFGNNCSSNSFGDDCYYNSFGNNCYYNSFGNNCYYNSFGDDCGSNSFGDNCYYNSFGNYTQENSVGFPCEYIIFDSGVSFLDISITGYYKISNYHITLGVKGNNPNTKLSLTLTGGRDYKTTVARKSDGTIIQYCEADLIPAE